MAWKVAVLSTLGHPSLVDLVEALQRDQLDVAAIILDGATPDVRGNEIEQERLGALYEARPITELEPYRVPVFFVSDHNNGACVELVRRLNVEVLVNGGTPRRLKAPLLEAPRRGVVNSHPGLLPKYRGATCVEWSIYHDDQVGATCHFMDGGVDTGPIIYAELLKIKTGWTYPHVRYAMKHHVIAVMVKGLLRVQQEDLSPCDLPAQGEGCSFHPIPKE